VSNVRVAVKAHLVEHFGSEPDTASVTFLGVEPIDVLRFAGGADVYHHVSLGCSRHPMAEPTDFVADPNQGPRAEVMVSLRGPTPTGLSQSIAIVAAAPAVEGLVLVSDALIDLEAPLWARAPFTAMLLGLSEVPDLELPGLDQPVAVFAATPITPTEAAWVRLKGADAMREAWRTDGVDVRDPARRAASPS
jgi:hypothetical protein